MIALHHITNPFQHEHITVALLFCIIQVVKFRYTNLYLWNAENSKGVDSRDMIWDTKAMHLHKLTSYYDQFGLDAIRKLCSVS